MKRLLYLTTILSITALFAGEGKINITSNKSLAYIYIDGEKRAMTGSKGVTTISIEEGEHTIKLIKPKTKRDNSYSSAIRTVYMGAKCIINLKFILDRD